MDATTELDPRTRRRALFAATMGCGLEFYDFLIFAFFAIQIGETFFPSTDPYLSLMGSLGTFWAGFLMRPVGAWVLGGYGDRKGRKAAMLLSMMLMGGSIAALALTPSYAAIGIAAPVIAILARCVQGFALGGEVGSSTVYMVEAGALMRRGRSAGYQVVSQGIANTLGAIVGLTLSTLLDAQQLTAFGWRIALLLGISIVPFALWMRRSIPETHGRPEPSTPGGDPTPAMRRIVVLGLLLISTGTILTYFQNYLVTFGQAQLKLSTQATMAAQLGGYLMFIVAGFAGGYASDRWGRKPVMMIPTLVLILGIVPMMAWVGSAGSIAAFVGVNLLVGFFNNVRAPAVYAALAESLPPARRTQSFSLIYALPVTILGGSTPMVMTWLIKVTGTQMVIAWYTTAVALVGILVMLLLPESAPARRRSEPPFEGLPTVSA